LISQIIDGAIFAPVEAVYPIEEIREALAHSQRNPGLPMAQPRMSEEACPAWLKRSESEDGLPPSSPTPSSREPKGAVKPAWRAGRQAK
jgi:hypothetical protein